MNDINCDVQSTTSRLFFCKKVKFHLMKIHKKYCHESLRLLRYASNHLSAGASPQTPLGELTALPQTPWLH